MVKPEEVVRAALTLMAAEQAGDDAAAIRAKIEHGWRQSQAGQVVDGSEAAYSLEGQWEKRGGHAAEPCSKREVAEWRPFDLDRICNTDFEIDHYQPIYYVLESFEQLRDAMNRYAEQVVGGPGLVAAGNR